MIQGLEPGEAHAGSGHWANEPDKQRQNHYEQIERSENTAGLDEVNAPPVVHEREEEQDTLEVEESARDKSLAERKNREKDVTSGRDREKMRELRMTIATAGWIVVLSIWAVLARLGLNALENYSGHMVFPLIWAQFIGCLIMGFATEVKPQWSHDGHFLALFVGITTGFCGSLTSFSSWMVDCFYAVANLNDFYDRPRGYNVLSLFTQLIITLTVSIAGLRLGAELGVFAFHLTRLPAEKQRGRNIGWAACLSLAAIMLGPLFLVGVALLIAFVPAWRGNVTFALLFGPMGALLRWQLARLNPRIKAFPSGTFLANIIATVIVCIVVLLQYRVDAGRVGCDVLLGIENGFCGALSTVSTFVLELVTLKRRHRWIYGLASVVLGLVVTILMLGIDAWTNDWRNHCAVI